MLSQLLAVRWSEPFENPYLKADATPETLGGGLYDDFTQSESIFNVYRADRANSFLTALQAWDTALRNERQGGQADIQALISLRQDVFGFSDVTYNTNRFRFETLTSPPLSRSTSVSFAPNSFAKPNRRPPATGSG